jgi:transcriptional regulator with XRE-family HTH domain
VRALRERRKLSLNELARRSGIAPSVLSRVETGERDDLRLSTAVRLCRALEISLDQLAGSVSAFRK